MHATVKFISAYTQICILASEHVRTYFVHAYIYTGSIYSYMRGVIKKYGQCLSKKNYYSKRHIAINSSQNLPPPLIWRGTSEFFDISKRFSSLTK